MSVINRTDQQRAMVDIQDLQNCRTTGTGASLVINGLMTVGSLFTGNLPLVYMSAFSFAGNWLGHTFARETIVRDDLRVHTYAIIHALTEKNNLLKEKDQLINDQRLEIEKLKTINLELEDKVQRLEQAQKSFDELNAEHLQILEDQKKQIEERSGFLSRLTGLVEGYETRKTKLLEEIGQAKEEREQLQQEIKSLLSQQKRINEQLAARITDLGDIADKMNGATKV